MGKWGFAYTLRQVISLAFDEPPGVLGLWFQDFVESHSQRPAGASARGYPTLLCHER